jgi:nicotinamidase-related amidase
MAEKLAEQSAPFLDYLKGWLAALPKPELSQVMTNPQNTALISVDVIQGFCKAGPLASPRVARIITPIIDLMRRVWDNGLRHIVLCQDTHEHDALEFNQYTPHCVRGSAESQAVAEIQALPFYTQMTVLEKNSINSGLNTGLDAWLAAHHQVDTFIVVGDCTDLCTYQLAMHLRLGANARQVQRRVIVPADCVETYDLPLEIAAQGVLPHPAALLHAVFLYHMAINGVEVVSCLV